jgi:hypothetical protein
MPETPTRIILITGNIRILALPLAVTMKFQQAASGILDLSRIQSQFIAITAIDDHMGTNRYGVAFNDIAIVQ